VLISVTLLENMGTTKRLIKKISSYFDIPIMIGGLSVNNIGEDEKRNIESTNPNVKVIIDCTLETLLQTIKIQINDSYKKKIGNYENNLI
jgi:MerR family transcriptional regulator, light-induced transcriptional regulator